MLELARRSQPAVEFHAGDAQALPLEDASFDAVLGNFVVLHLGRPEQAATEFARVLVPGGRAAVTVWDRPERARILGVFLDAFAEAGAVAPEDVPVGPDFFRFSVDDEFDALLAQAGLEERRVERLEFTHRLVSADELWHGWLDGTVRTSALILRQPDETQRRIREAFDERIEEFRAEDGFELPVSVKLASGRKPL
jgi:SAM-dependent methyltransferase